LIGRDILCKEKGLYQRHASSSFRRSTEPKVGGPNSSRRSGASGESVETYKSKTRTGTFAARRDLTETCLFEIGPGCLLSPGYSFVVLCPDLSLQLGIDDLSCSEYYACPILSNQQSNCDLLSAGQDIRPCAGKRLPNIMAGITPIDNLLLSKRLELLSGYAKTSSIELLLR
jgi:hypothetical protein